MCNFACLISYYKHIFKENMVIYQKKKAEASKFTLKGITVKHKDLLQVYFICIHVFYET